MNKNLFLKPCITSIFLKLNTKRGYYPKLYIDIGCTSLNLAKCLNQLEKKDLIVVSKIGREREVVVTNDGKIIANDLITYSHCLKAGVFIHNLTFNWV